ncbi:hypothetical protein F0358_10655 [Empedobacter brevis]|uniref:hypothetical protein n=1 Tax=Empedobacter brevis TaxID=247 RepID=UPI00123C7BC1|nr:hypothetical protein [Empedobacter brevis]QES93134.1 hypothetical protein F0358_10655 [Empedobacter brevis]
MKTVNSGKSMDYESLEINYLELAFISGKSSNDKLSSAESKEIFRRVLQLPIDTSIKRKDVIKVKLLKKYFKPVISVDTRFDGMNSLVFFLSQKSGLYKKYLSNQGVIKKGSLLGGKAVLWKIMSDEQKENFTNIVYPKHLAYKQSQKRNI